MEEIPLSSFNLNMIIDRIGYGRYQAVVIITLLKLVYAQGVEVIIIGIYEKYLINRSEFSDTSISIICTLINLGFTLGLGLSSILGNRIGRLKVLKISYSIILISVFSSSFFMDSIVFCPLRIATNFAIGYSAPVVYIYFIESCPKYNRGYFSVSLDFVFNFGEILGLGLTYLFMKDVNGENSAFILLAPYSLIIIPILFLFFYLKETPWYLSSLGKTEELIETLDFISIQNLGTRLSESEKEGEESKDIKTVPGFYDVLKNVFKKDNLIVALKIAWIRLSLSIGYLGSIFFIPFLFSSNTFYLGYLLLIFCNLPFMAIISYSIENKNFGRKKTLLCSMIILIIISINLIIFRDEEVVLLVLIGCLGGLSSVSDTVSGLYAAEFYETDVRAASTSIIYFFGRIQFFYLATFLVYLTQNPVALFSFFTVIYIVKN